MKNTIYRWLIPIVLLIYILAGCKDDKEIGMELLPSTDLLSTKRVTEKSQIRAFTYVEDSVRTDETARSLLGSFNDSIFGNTTIDFAAQFRLSYYPDYGVNPKVDSVYLYLYYRLFYGDTSTVQRIHIYELDQDLDVDADYYHDSNLKSLAKPQPLATYSFKPRIRLDSIYKDTIYQLLRINIGNVLGRRLAMADSLDMTDNDVFLKYFKGLYFETEKVTGGRGGLLSLETLANDSINGSGLAVYFHNDKPDTSFHSYVISKFSARVNSYRHDYSQTRFFNTLNMENSPDSLLFIQPTAGLKSKIYIDNLKSWRDSDKVVINKAEMVFQIDTIASDFAKYAPPSQLLLTFIDKDGGNFLPVDYAFSPTFYGGYILKDYTYRFNITQLFTQIIDGKVDEKGFFLTTLNRNSEANRVILKGSTSKTGIHFNITYTRLNR